MKQLLAALVFLGALGSMSAWGGCWRVKIRTKMFGRPRAWSAETMRCTRVSGANTCDP